MAGTCNTRIYVLLVVMFFAFPFMQRLEFVCGNTSLGYSNVSCLESEKKALLQFKRSLIDESNILSSWVGDDCCTWYGVGCSKVTGNVLKLDLRSPYENYCFYDYDSSHCLKGAINASLQNLKFLTFLDLSMNNFLGIQIPEFFGSLKNLEHLDLSYLNIVGKVPHYLGNLSRLQYLDLSGNEFNGSIPTGISKLTQLRHLNLSLNQFQGSIPSEMRNLGQLTYLDLSRNKFSGSIPSEISNITKLTHLDLSSNAFNGSIPTGINNLTQLRHLDLNYNEFQGLIPSEMRNLGQLRYLDFHRNNFSGSIPSEINNLTQLAHLDLSRNEFNGSIPTGISNLTQLSYLDLSRNEFTGNLPPSFERLTSLKTLDMSSNRLSGVIPVSIGQLSKLETLDLHDTLIAGIMSDNHFVNLTRLRYLDLNHNRDLSLNFSSTWTPPFQLRSLGLGRCKVGPQFPQWLQNQTHLEYVSISGGSISDTIPDWFENLYSGVMYLDLSHNQIKGNWFERMTLHSRIQFLYMDNNQLTGKLILFIPSNLIDLDLSNNLFSGIVVNNNDTTQKSSLARISLPDNGLVGGFPTCLCNITTLAYLQLSNNQISGQLPSCLGNLKNLMMLDVRNNTLSGLVPPSLGYLQDLLSLHLHNNKFHGKLPSSFQHLTNLVALDLAQNDFTDVIPPWIGQSLSNLRFLSLRSNKFHGAIPLQLCQLSNLQLLNLAQNNISGSIPSCFGNFTSMVWIQSADKFYEILFASFAHTRIEMIIDSMKGTELEYSSALPVSIDLSNNFIVGEIPKELMGLVGLLTLNLAGNQIKGRIPENIGSLRQLLRLDLSRNKLSGLIPQSLSNLSFLSQLNLSFNDFTGRLPTGHQLQTLNDPSMYIGNNDLCGPPILKICPGDQESPDHNHGKESESEDEDDDDDDDHLWFYSGLGPGFAVGFLAFCGTLYFNKSWRYAYFHFIEKVCNALAVAIALKTTSLRRKFCKHGTK